MVWTRVGWSMFFGHLSQPLQRWHRNTRPAELKEVPRQARQAARGDNNKSQRPSEIIDGEESDLETSQLEYVVMFLGKGPKTKS